MDKQSLFWGYVQSVRIFYNQITDFLAAWSKQKRKAIFAEAGRSKVDRFCWDSMWYDPSSSLERTTAKAWRFPASAAHSFIMFSDALIPALLYADSISSLLLVSSAICIFFVRVFVFIYCLYELNRFLLHILLLSVFL